MYVGIAVHAIAVESNACIRKKQSAFKDKITPPVHRTPLACALALSEGLFDDYSIFTD